MILFFELEVTFFHNSASTLVSSGFRFTASVIKFEGWKRRVILYKSIAENLFPEKFVFCTKCS